MISSATFMKGVAPGGKTDGYREGNVATIHIDNQSYPVNERENLLQSCLSQGLDLPYFCWHPALGSVGACRQCAVKIYRDENDKVGRLVMACMTPAADNTRITITDPESKEFREAIIALM